VLLGSGESLGCLWVSVESSGCGSGRPQPAWLSSISASARQQADRDVDQSAPKVLAQALGLGIGTGRRGHPLAEQAHHHEVEGTQVRERIAPYLQLVGFGQQGAELVEGEVVVEPRPGLVAPGPQPDVGIAPLVAGAGTDDGAER